MSVTEGEIQSISSAIAMLKLILDIPCGSTILLLISMQKRLSFI